MFDSVFGTNVLPSQAPLCLSTAVFCGIAFYLGFEGMINGSWLLHNTMLGNVLKSPLQFFDTNPTGRIVARFASDINSLDKIMPDVISDFLICLFEVGIFDILLHFNGNFLIF